MKVQFENIAPDSGSSFKLIHWKSENDRFFWHQHPEYEILFVKQGTGKVHIGNYVGSYNEGDLLFLGPNLPHTGLGYGVIGEHEEMIIQLKENFLGEIFWEIPEVAEIKHLFELSKQGIIFYGNEKYEIAQQIEELFQLSGIEKLIGLLQIFKKLAATQNFQLLNTHGSRFDFRHQEEERINRIYIFVEENFQQPIELQKVADLANLTVPSFCRYFKKMTRMTFTDFVNEYRINQACRLLQYDKSIAEVCFESGFSNVSHFNKTFKTIMKKSPRNYRNSL